MRARVLTLKPKLRAIELIEMRDARGVESKAKSKRKKRVDRHPSMIANQLACNAPT